MEQITGALTDNSFITGILDKVAVAGGSVPLAKIPSFLKSMFDKVDTQKTGAKKVNDFVYTIAAVTVGIFALFSFFIVAEKASTK